MKSLIKVILFLMAIVFSGACTVANYQTPSKYSLDSQLEQVNPQLLWPTYMSAKFYQSERKHEKPDSGFHMSDASEHEWIKVDSQSLIVKKHNKYFFLVVLKNPIPTNLLSHDTIGLKDGFLAIGNFPGDAQKFLIDRVYKIEDKDQAREIKARLLGIPVEHITLYG